MKPPMIGGIDLVGTVLEAGAGSPHTVGSKVLCQMCINVWCASNSVLQVLCNGWGVGTDHYGGYAGEARLQSAWAIPLPAGQIGAQRAQVECIRALRLMSPYFSRAERRAGSTDRHGRLHRHALRGRSGEWFNYFSARPRVCDAAFPHTIAHTLLCLKPSVVLNVSPIWAGSIRTQGQG